MVGVFSTNAPITTNITIVIEWRQVRLVVYQNGMEATPIIIIILASRCHPKTKPLSDTTLPIVELFIFVVRRALHVPLLVKVITKLVPLGRYTKAGQVELTQYGFSFSLFRIIHLQFATTAGQGYTNSHTVGRDLLLAVSPHLGY